MSDKHANDLPPVEDGAIFERSLMLFDSSGVMKQMPVADFRNEMYWQDALLEITPGANVDHISDHYIGLSEPSFRAGYGVIDIFMGVFTIPRASRELLAVCIPVLPPPGSNMEYAAFPILNLDSMDTGLEVRVSNHPGEAVGPLWGINLWNTTDTDILLDGAALTVAFHFKYKKLAKIAS